LKDDNTIRKSTSKLVRMVQKLKNDKNRDDSLLFSRAQIAYGVSNGHVTDDVTWPQKVKLLTPIGLRLQRSISKTAGDAI